MIRSGKKKWPQVLLIGLLCGLFVFLLSKTEFLERLELKLYDLRMGSMAPSFGKEALGKIVIVDMDNESSKRIDAPFILWNPYLNLVIKNIQKAGARVVGIDMIQRKPTPSFFFVESRDGSYQKKELPTDWDQVLAKTLYEGKVILPLYFNEDNTVVTPINQLAYAVGLENLGFVNATVDCDGVIRRQAMFKDDAEGKISPCFPLLVALKYQGKDLSGSQNEASRLVENIPLDDNGQMLINFAGPPKTFRYEPFWKVLEKANNHKQDYFEETFRDKIVLIGTSDIEQLDFAATPMGGPSESKVMPGVEILANAVQTIANGAFIRPVPYGGSFFLIMALCVMAAMVIYLTNFRVSLLFTSLALLGCVFINVYLLDRHQLLLNLSSPLLCLLMTLAVTHSYKYFLEFGEKKKLTETFGRYVSKPIADEIMKHSDNISLEGKKENVTILFCDIDNFTPLCERLTVEDVVVRLNRFFELMVECIFKHQGTVNKFIGDEIMVVFGAPVPCPDHAACACRCALEMIRILENVPIAPDDPEQDGKMKVKIGLNSGDVVSGSIGSHQRMEYTVIGDVVNTASRIMHVNKTLGTSILISQSTFFMARDKIVAEPKGKFPLKGKKEDVEVYELREIREVGNEK
ncbi:MAG: adenylate/guanylate cyclase domain-containing protein [bacterium]